MNNELSNYINGLVNMASSVSNKISCSYIIAYCFNKDCFIKEFTKQFKIKKIVLEPVDDHYLTNYLEDSLIDKLNYWLKFKIGHINSVYVINNVNLKNILFSYVEDIIVLEYDDYMLSLIIGNNE